MTNDWQARGKAKAEAIRALIPPEWRLAQIPSAEEQRDVTGAYIHQFLSPAEVDITETDAVGIVAKTSTGQWKAVEVAKAFCHRVALAHQLYSLDGVEANLNLAPGCVCVVKTNCLLEIFFTAALAQAAKLDDFFAANKRPTGPLHGLPVSLKDQFHVKGVGTTMGYVGWIDTFEGRKGTGNEGVFESELTKELVKCGAILYCKTSVPQTLMCTETENNVIGITLNPKNRLISPGGSSGGEGALIGLRGSPIGFGSDIGGSVRIPAAANGLYGLRSSTGRIPYEGAANSIDGQSSILSVLGPIATSVASLEMMFRAVMSQKPWLHDPLVLEMPWRDHKETETKSLLSGKLCFGLLLNDGVVTPSPPVQRAVRTVASVLQKLGHEVIEWKAPPTTTLAELAYSIFEADGGNDIRNALKLSGEPPIPQLGRLYQENSSQKFAGDVFDLNVAKRQLQKEYMEFWNSSIERTSTGRPVDAVIAPVGPFPAPPIRGALYPDYTMFVNVLDYTSIVVPVTNVDRGVDVVDTTYMPAGDADRAVYEAYKPELFDGAHVSVQLIGRRLEEEKMLVLGEYVDRAIKAAKA